MSGTPLTLLFFSRNRYRAVLTIISSHLEIDNVPPFRAGLDMNLHNIWVEMFAFLPAQVFVYHDLARIYKKPFKPQ